MGLLQKHVDTSGHVFKFLMNCHALGSPRSRCAHALVWWALGAQTPRRYLTRPQKQAEVTWKVNSWVLGT